MPRVKKLSDSEVVASYRSFLEGSGGVHPRQTGGAEERYLHRRIREVDSAESRALAPPLLRSAEDNARAAVAFTKEHGHTPRGNASDPEEQRLGRWVIMDFRRQVRNGKVSPKVYEIASECPELVSVRVVPDQDEMLDRLRAFCEENGCLPKYWSKDPDERSIARWYHNNSMAGRSSDDPRVSRRYEEVRRIRDEYAGKPNPRSRKRREEESAFVRDNGYLPSGAHQSTKEAFPDAPTEAEFRRRQKFAELRAYVDEHGHLPSLGYESAVSVFLTNALRSPSDRNADVLEYVKTVPHAPRGRRKRES